MSSTTRTILIIIALVALLALAGGIYWYFFFNGPGGALPAVSPSPGTTGGFRPLVTSPRASSTAPTGSPGATVEPTPGATAKPAATIPVLRLLSNTPVGGYGASTTASTTIVRWVDRGRGNVYEVDESSSGQATLSNTILPRVYESAWNKNMTGFIASILPAESNVPSVLYAELRSHASSTAVKAATSSTATSSANSGVQTPAQASGSATLAPYDLKGKQLPAGILAYAASPQGDKVLFVADQNGSGVGYVANFDGTAVKQLWSTPLTQIAVEWPEANTITVTTKGANGSDGYLYFVNAKTGAWNKVLGPIKGLATRTSHDARFIFASSVAADQSVKSSIYSLSGTTTEAVVRTLADKCAWGNFYRDIVYCAVPKTFPAGIYPDDWYRGNVSFSDDIWQINALTSEATHITDLTGPAGHPLDAISLSPDAKDGFLFFIHKNGLSLWSLDLVRTN